MFPVYPYCQGFPHQMELNSYPCQYHPGWEVMPPQIKTDSFKHPSVPVPYPFSFGDNMCWPKSIDHGNCCHQSCCPGYHSFKPQFAHVQPVPQLYHHGPFPPYPNPYPAYFVPPPHYSIDQARYDYDKSREHCCGCSNHRCHVRDDSSPKVEEQKPDKEQDKAFSGQIRLPNYTSSVVRFPTSSINDREGDKAAQVQPGCWNGWMPLDINSRHGLTQEDGGKEAQEKEVRQDEGRWSQKRSPFPIIWMPGYDKPEQSIEDFEGITPKSVEDCPSKFQIIPLKLLESGNNGERQKTEHEVPKSPVQAETQLPKESKTKTIPVKKMEDSCKKADTIPEKPVAHVDEKRGEISESQKEQSEANKASEKKESSLVRSSKLPPVCLRVDPLPRKKKNGTSRSPSPPGHKDMRNHEQREEQSPRRERREEITEKVIPVVDVKNSTLSQPGVEQKCQQSVPVASLNDSSKESVTQEAASPEEFLTAKDVVDGSKISESESKDCMSAGQIGNTQKIVVDDGPRKSSDGGEVKDKRGMKRDLSQSDAALIIQSAYRGYDVRRWCPLAKLKKIAKVRQQVDNLKRQIQSIKASPKQLDAKQRMVIGETIMSLLLELDTIQGLHPSIREARKSVARELVYLQEEVDSLVGQITEEHESMNVEADGRTTADADFVGSGAETQQPLIRESLEDKISSAGDAATKEAAEDGVCMIDLPSNEHVDIVGASVSREPTTEQQLVQPMEVDGGEGELSFGIDEADRYDTGTTTVASSCDASEPVFDQGTEISIKTELPSELVQQANKNGASGNPSLDGKESELKEETYEDSMIGGPTTESDGLANATLLVNNGHRVIDSSSNPVAGTDEKVSKPVAGEASVSLVVTDRSESSAESEYCKYQAAPVDPSAEDDAVLLHKLEETPIQTSEQGNSLGEIAMLEDERGNLASDDAGHSIMSVADDERLETETVSSPKQPIEDSGNAMEEISVLPPVDANDRTNTSVQGENDDGKDLSNQKLVMEAKTVKETESDNLKVSGITGVAEGNEVEEPKISSGISESNNEKKLKGFARVAESNEKEPNGVGDEIEGSTRDACLLIRKDAAKEEGAGPGPETHALGPNEVLEAMSEEAGEVAGPNIASTDMKKEEKRLLEENEKLREMLKKLLDAGKEQVGVISELNGRVKKLEKKLTVQRKRKTKVKRNTPANKLHACGVSC